MSSILSILSILMDISQKRTKNARKPMGPFKVPHVIIFCGCFSQVDEMSRNTRPTCSGLELRFFFFEFWSPSFVGIREFFFFWGDSTVFLLPKKKSLDFRWMGWAVGVFFFFNSDFNQAMKLIKRSATCLNILNIYRYNLETSEF